MANRPQRPVERAIIADGTEVDIDDKGMVIEDVEEEVVPEIKAQVNNKVATPADLKGGKGRLSSGLVVELRRAKLLSLAAAGKIPNPLISVAVKVAKGSELVTDDEKEGKTPAEIKKAEADAIIEQEKLIDIVVCNVLVSPKVVLTEEEETDDNIWVGSLDALDKYEVFQWSQAGAALWAKFRI